MDIVTHTRMEAIRSRISGGSAANRAIVEKTVLSTPSRRFRRLLIPVTALIRYSFLGNVCCRVLTVSWRNAAAIMSCWKVLGERRDCGFKDRKAEQIRRKPTYKYTATQAHAEIYVCIYEYHSWI